MSGFAVFAMMLSSQIESPSLGKGVPPPCLWMRRVIVKIEVSRSEDILTQARWLQSKKAARFGAAFRWNRIEPICRPAAAAGFPVAVRSSPGRSRRRDNARRRGLRER
ncbi:hypothetical protein EHI44_24955 [Rhizobium leguminosarum]|uniref:Uncharacterized protein n=1 Tax=Rhizobium leguminosarum TaxID=384 RepID=A0ABD7PV27_RHILE|nr:hypothetical protein EHI44_24955 [Rhizobium leguminosarum]TAV75257.1 hypothetical protein ELI28_17830 [Rhizobium leguminosarum]TAV79856.1 hypothetical protein ELI27_17815 [Rhizobium leguminosarum]TAW31192.1 hypothetical protein ELI19_17570 [Rhizobium leguminosarum]TAW44920.1 hypothetical protein ELI18_17525 [Rhizobium leguminosarum]